MVAAREWVRRAMRASIAATGIVMSLSLERRRWYSATILERVSQSDINSRIEDQGSALKIGSFAIGSLWKSYRCHSGECGGLSCQWWWCCAALEDLRICSFSVRRVSIMLLELARFWRPLKCTEIRKAPNDIDYLPDDNSIIVMN